MRLVDANIFVRYLAHDVPEHALASKALFDRVAANEEEVFVAEAVVAEVVFVLTSPRIYALPRVGAAGRIAALLSPSGIRMPAKEVCLRGLEVYAQSPFLDFPDALLAAYAESEAQSVIISYDRDYDRIDGITRLEPVAP